MGGPFKGILFYLEYKRGTLVLGSTPILGSTHMSQRPGCKKGLGPPVQAPKALRTESLRYTIRDLFGKARALRTTGLGFFRVFSGLGVLWALGVSGLVISLGLWEFRATYSRGPEIARSRPRKDKTRALRVPKARSS